MKTIVHKAHRRGHINHGWLNTYHSFSFGSYYNPDRMRFGALRVLNDDQIAPGMGFGLHPHENMEIVTIMLKGQLRHTDSMGNSGILSQGEIQTMSAGTGIYHSEENSSPDQETELLQIWVVPGSMNVAPRYEQHTIDLNKQTGTFSHIVGPITDTNTSGIHQQAWFSLGTFNTSTKKTYQLHSTHHGLYVFVITGSATIDEQTLGKRDAMGIWQCNSVDIAVQAESTVLLIEVPMLQ